MSTEEQKRKQNPIDTQERVCRELCERSFGPDGYQLEFYVDAGLSGTLGPREEGGSGKFRPEFTRLIEAIQGGRIDVLACQSLDRLARDEADMFLLRRALVKRGINIATPDRSYDLRDHDDVLMMGFHAMMAAYQPRQTAVKSVEGKRQRARRGLPKSGGAPYGWRLQTVQEATDPNARSLVRVEPQAIWMARMAEKYLSGWGYGKIATWLEEEGASPPGRAGWYKVAVKQLLENCKHAGLIEVAEGEYVEGQHSPDRIYDPQVFHELRREMARRAKLPGVHASSSYWLTGTLTCGECGEPMRASNHSDRRYYQHRSAWDQNRQSCTVNACNAEHLETAALQAMREFAGSDRVQRLVGDEVDALLSADDRQLERQAAEKRKQLEEARERVGWLIDQAARHPELRADFDRRIEEAQQRREELSAECEDLGERGADIERRRRRAERVHELLQDFDAVWAALDGDERRNLAHMVFDELAVLPAQAGHILRMRVFLDEPREVFIPAGKSGRRPKWGPRSLTPREAAALYLLDRGCSRAEIADQWGTEKRNVAILLDRARQKLQADSAAAAIAVARDYLQEIAPFLPVAGALENAPAPDDLTPTERELLPEIADRGHDGGTAGAHVADGGDHRGRPA